MSAAVWKEKMAEAQSMGYTGNLLRVDLSAGSFTTETISETVRRRYLGGAGFVAYYLLNEVPPDCDPLGPDNKLIFAAGPISGTTIPGSGRHCVGARSPLTQGVAKSEVGEYWAAALKKAGFDLLIVEGVSPKPVYLSIDAGKPELKDAGHLWGKETKETQEAIREEMGGGKVRVSMIGPGGESQVLYACIMCGLFDAAGRGGMGAVMGSKNLKAIALKGGSAPKVANPAGVKATAKWFVDNMNLMAGMADLGTAAAQVKFYEVGNVPIRNFRDAEFPNSYNLTALNIKHTIRQGMEGCWCCPVKCKKIVAADEPYPVIPEYGGPEYESLGALGSCCGVDDVVAVSYANQLCNAYSLDVISTGVCIAFAMECYENGLLTKQDTGGVDLRFGNIEAMLECIELIAHNRGFGAFLAQGTARMSAEIGQGSEAFAMNVKGLEFGMHEPRISKGFGMGCMVNPTGADHMSGMIDVLFSGLGGSGMTTLPDGQAIGVEPAPYDSAGPAKIRLAHTFMCKRALFDSLVICGFMPYSLQMAAQITRDVTGWNTTEAEQLRVAERVLTALRLYNIRCGKSEVDDRLPQRLYQAKQGGDPKEKLDPAQMEAARKYYYSIMGWDKQGVPTLERLDDLAIQ